MGRIAAILALAGGLAATGALAQTESTFRNQDAAPGKPVRLGLYGNVAKDCKAGPPPEVRVVTPPKNGNLAVRGGKTKTNRIPGCSEVEAEVRGVFYEAKGGYKGADEVVYEVRRPEGKVETHTVRITVTDKPGAAPAPAPASKPRGGVVDL